jgi:hypothetical protein
MRQQAFVVRLQVKLCHRHHDDRQRKKKRTWRGQKNTNSTCTHFSMDSNFLFYFLQDQQWVLILALFVFLVLLHQLTNGSS